MTVFADIVEEGSGGHWPAALPDHLSASSLTQFLRCPEQFRRVRILGERQRPAGALIWGSADHGAHEENFRQKIDSHEDLPEGEFKEVVAASFDTAVKRNGGHSEVDWGKDKPGEMKDRCISLASAYHRQVSPTVQPLAVEERFEVDLPGVPVKMLGFVDVRAVVGNRRTLIERKTSARKVSELKPDWRLQGLLYQAVTDSAVDWHVSVKSKTPAVYTPLEEQALTLPYRPEAVATAQRMVANAARQLAATYQTFGPDEPWPGAATYGWACGYCGFRDDCAWWSYERAAA